jgi:hypothetical protein
VAASFGDRVTCALSGGYDSRLILALLRRHGVSPRVYVYGPPGDKDVELARTIVVTPAGFFDSPSISLPGGARIWPSPGRSDM